MKYSLRWHYPNQVNGSKSNFLSAGWLPDIYLIVEFIVAQEMDFVKGELKMESGKWKMESEFCGGRESGVFVVFDSQGTVAGNITAR